ncbi:MAG: thioredoxin [Clostridiaceae bacterium]|nr:thioredoxin [Clostridiaceae bacterium]
MSSEKVVELTKDSFEQEVMNSKGLVLVDFWAAWCGPCRMVAPVIDQLADEFQDKLVVAKVNVDDEGELATRFRIMSIPTIILFKDGEIAERLIGVRTKDEFKSVIDKYL